MTDSELTATPRSGDGVRSLERGLALLRAMNRDPHASVTELARQIGVPRSTAYRLLDTLTSSSYTAANLAAGGFRLTREVRRLSDGFIDEEWLDLVWPTLRSLGDDIVWPVSLFTQEAATMVIRRTTHAQSTMSIDYGMTGRRMPITETAAGRAHLAFCTESERQVILNLPESFGGPRTPMERELLDRALKRTKQEGYGTRVGGVVSKTSSISVPVMLGDRVLCCVSVVWISSAINLGQATSAFVGILQDAANTIASLAERSQKLGAHPRSEA